MSNLRQARNAACAAQSAMDKLVHALTEAALDEADGGLNAVELAAKAVDLAQQATHALHRMRELMGGGELMNANMSVRAEKE